MHIQLHDNGRHLSFAPLSLTRPVGDLRMGIFTNAERWKWLLPSASITFHTAAYLRPAFAHQPGELMINACVIPDQHVKRAVLSLNEDERLVFEGEWIAYRGAGNKTMEYTGSSPVVLSERWQLYQWNDAVLKSDFELITAGRTSVQLSSSNTLIGNPSDIFVEEGARVEAAVLNAAEGPIYIGKNCEIMEGALIRGPFALCEGSVVKMGAKIYGATTVGPFCKVGGEISNTLFQAYSNKGHDGFLGNALIGSWCNLGADTNTSNLKNNYGKVRTYSYAHGKQIDTELIFMGLAMGDHSKTGINTMFNTASVVGVCCNVFGAEFPDKYLPSFSWGMHGDRYDFKKALIDILGMMERRGQQLTAGETEVLSHLFEQK